LLKFLLSFFKKDSYIINTMSTPATFEPATLPPNDQYQSGGLGIDPMAHTKHKQEQKNWEARQEEIAEAKAKARANYIKHEKPNPTDPQHATSIFDSSLSPDRRSQAHLANPHY
jgi:hypothetical protein